MIQRSLLRTFQTATRHTPRLQRSQIPNVPASAVSRLRLIPSASARSFSQRPRCLQESEARKEEVREEQADAQGQGDQATTAEAQAPKDGPVKAELEAKKKEIVDLTDRVKRSVAEYRNLQEQTRREVQAAKDFALQRFAKDLLDSIDNLDRALTTVPADQLTDANKDLVNLHSGLKMTEQILMQTLKRHGLERFDPAGEGEGGAAMRFDPNKMEATFQAPQQGREDGTVFYTQAKGFTLNGRVLRAAKVGVVKNS